MITAQRISPDIAFSVFRFLRETAYTVNGQDNVLAGHFPNLVIRAAYPTDLVSLLKPTLAVGSPEQVVTGATFYGGLASSSEHVALIPIYGFVMGRGSDEANRLYRDQLLADLQQLVEQHGGEDGITLYDAASKAARGNVEVSAVRARLLPANAPELEVERFKFVVEVEIPFIE